MNACSCGWEVRRRFSAETKEKLLESLPFVAFQAGVKWLSSTFKYIHIYIFVLQYTFKDIN